jgi:hypothetical protein
MSGLVQFVIHYRYGAIRSSDARADLSDFEYHVVEFTDPPSIRIGEFKRMLMVFLGWDRKLYTVSLQALWSNSTSNIYCQLKEIEHTRRSRALSTIEQQSQTGNHEVESTQYYRAAPNRYGWTTPPP